MEVNQRQITILSNRLPKLELSYETVVHKKVSSVYDICVSMPMGKRQFAWFTYDDEGDACYLMDLTKDGKIGRISQIVVESKLSFGTILYGTLCEIDGLKFFVVDDIYYYKGIYVKPLSFGEKIGFMYDAITNCLSSEFKDISSIVFKMACMETISEKDDIESQAFYETAMGKSAYVSHHLQFRSTTQIMPYLNHTFKPRVFNSVAPAIEPKIYIPRNDMDFSLDAYKNETVFRVMADIQSDIYLLYAYNETSENKFDFVDIAYIGSRKESVFMNSLFRNIRENLNVDYGEESEDEDMFQNTNIDKYVDLKREYKMVCSFHHKFKKWVPLRTVDSKTRCVNIGQLIRKSRPDNQRSYEKHVDQRSVNQRSVNQRSVDQRYVDQRSYQKPVEQRSYEKPVYQRSVDQRSVDQRSVDQRSVDQRSYQKPVDQRSFKQKSVDQRSYQKPVDQRSYQKPVDQRSVDQRSVDQRSVDKRSYVPVILPPPPQLQIPTLKPVFSYNKERFLF